jgi:hypothetical protein
MEIAQKTRFETAQREARSHDVTILLGYSVFAILLLIGVYWVRLRLGSPLANWHQ